MKDSRMTIWVMVVVLAMAVGHGFGWTQYNDGGTHDISTTINDDVWVDYLAPGMGTTVNVLSGGSIPSPYKIQGFNDGQINIDGGTVGGEIYTYNNTQLTLNSGTLSSESFCYNDTQVRINGGSLDIVWAYDNTQATINGNSTGNLVLCDNSQVTMNAGSFGAITSYENSQIFMDGGLTHSLSVRGGSSRITMTGGTANYLQGFSNTQITMTGGLINADLYLAHDAQADWSGGNIGGDLTLQDRNILTIFGSNFTIDGNPVGYGNITSILGNDYSLDPSRILSGTLADSTTINNQFKIGNSAYINLVYAEPVPEPCTLLLFGLGGLVLRKRRQ